MELKHFISLIAELPQNSQFKYVRGEDICTFVNVEITEPRIFTKTPQGKDFSFAGSYLSLLAERIEANVPFNISQLMNNSGSNRPVVETIVAHTKEFYWLQKNGAKFVVWIPSHPHNVGELVQWTDLNNFENKADTEKAKSQQTNNNTDYPSYQIIFYGAPGTGKSHEVKRITGECDDEGQKNVFRTTFHPDTDYATFVGCYKPTMKDVPEKYKAVAGKDSEISYEFVPQTFTDAYVYAYKHPDTTTYLVIEEINRGNCAQIFGDLFQLLDRKEDGTSEYRIKADKDLAKHLINEGVACGDPKDVKLCLPANLHILATMNTSDQSLFPMDSAFKRRWDWEYIPISYTEEKSSAFEIEIGEEKYSWVKFIEAVNKRILNLTDSEDKMMGNFFIKSSVNKQQFKSKVMFYLWNEVLRDEVGNQKYFFYWRDENNKDHSFKFNEIYEKDSDMILKGFMAYIFEKKFNQKSESSVDE